MNTVNWHTLTDAGRAMLLDAAIAGEVQVGTLKEWSVALALKQARLLRPKDGTLAFSAWVLTAGGSAVVNENTESERAG